MLDCLADLYFAGMICLGSSSMIKKQTDSNDPALFSNYNNIGSTDNKN